MLILPADRACLFELTTAHAILSKERQLWSQLLRLGIGTPFTVQRATLQEDIGSYARTIVKRIALNVKDHSLYFFQPRTFRWRERLWL